MLRCRNCGNILEIQDKNGLCRRCEKTLSDRCPTCHGERPSVANEGKKCPTCQGTAWRK